MARRANGEGSITTTIRNGKTYYRGSITIGMDNKGKAIRKTFGSFKKTIVIDKMNTVKYESKNNIFSNSDITFGELFRTWILDFKRVEIGSKTLVKYETTYNLRIEPYSISNKAANKITLNDLQQYFNSLQENFSPATIKETYTHINSCFKFALLQGTIIRNYSQGVVLPKRKKENKLKVFSRQEQDLIISSLDLRDIIDCMIYITFYTGLRLGEILGLRWSNIKDNILKVDQQYARTFTKTEDGKFHTKKELKNLKTKNSEREIPLPEKVIKVLDELDKTHDLIFSSNGKGLDHKKPQRRITKICKNLKIPHRSFHSIRHSYATRLFELDVPIKTVQVLMGHSDITTTMNIYTHVMQDKKMEVLDKLNTL